MHSPDPMTREQLLELAALDAAGLLDEYESALYTRSFHHAPVQVQRDLIELQARIVSDETLLPEAEPSAELRERVLAAVARAIEADTHHGPIATIGRPRLEPGPIVSRIPAGQGGIVWRAASFILFASLVVMGYFLSEAHRYNHEISGLAINSNTSETLEKLIGPTVKDFLFDRTAQPVRFDEVAPATPQLRAMILMRADQVFLITDGLPASRTPAYVLEMVEPDGTTHVLDRFASNGLIGGLVAALPSAAVQGTSFRITDLAGNLMMTATV